MKLRSPLLIQILASVFTVVIWLLFRTLRLRFREETPGTNPYAASTKDRFIYCVWHDSMIIPAFGGKHVCAAALTSHHGDGSFVAHVLRMVGMSIIRGSTNHIRHGAMRQLIQTAAGKHLVITPDGPRGPRRQMSKGIVFLASHTGRAIVPTAYGCSRCWKVKASWTDQVVPKPFSEVLFLAGDPIEVPLHLRDGQLQQYVELVQAEMDRLNAEVECLAARKQAKSAKETSLTT